MDAYLTYAVGAKDHLVHVDDVPMVKHVVVPAQNADQS